MSVEWRDTNPERLLRAAYQAFHAQDIEAVLALLHPQVDWANGMEGGSICTL